MHSSQQGIFWFAFVSFGFLRFPLVSFDVFWFSLVWGSLDYVFPLISFGFLRFPFISFCFRWFLLISSDFLWFGAGWILWFSFGFLCFPLVLCGFQGRNKEKKHPRKRQTNQGKSKEAISSQNASIMPVTKTFLKYYINIHHIYNTYDQWIMEISIMISILHRSCEEQHLFQPGSCDAVVLAASARPHVSRTISSKNSDISQKMFLELWT